MPLRLVIFDCDGVLVDSEPLVARVVARNLTKLGWRMNALESQRMFMGMSLPDMMPVIERKVGKLPPGWLNDLQLSIQETLADGVPWVPGALATLQATSALGLPWRIASNSSRAELEIKSARTGLDRLIAPDRMHSAGDLMTQGGRGKPAPDLFLHAAALEAVSPADCIVIEDSVPGVRGAMAAGMTVFGFAPHGDGKTLRFEGASIIRRLDALPALFRAAMRQDATA
jgi:HAD superfamily hydrolase (TIGR01509 family)